MNLIKKLALVSTLLVIMVSPATTFNAVGEVYGDDPPIVTYSTDLEVGDIYTWNVVQATFSNDTVIEDRDYLGLLEGDVITIEILADLTGYNPNDYSLDEDDYLDVKVNGVDTFVFLVIDYIYPLEAEWDNGTQMNYIIWDFMDSGFDDEISSIETEGDEIVARTDLDFLIEVHEEIRVDKNTGVLNYYYFETNFFLDIKLKVVKEGYTKPPIEPTTTYSSELVVDSVYIWNVEQSTYWDGTVVTGRDSEHGYLVNDEISIRIIDDVTSLNDSYYILDTNDYFEMKLDGVADSFEWSEIEFILPILASWSNGADMHFIEWYFYYYLDYSGEFTSIKTEGEEIVIEVDHDEEVSYVSYNHHEEIRFDKDSGVLNYYNLESSINDWKLTIVREGYSKPGSDDPSLSFGSLLHAVTGLFVIHIITRYRRRE